MWRREEIPGARTTKTKGSSSLSNVPPPASLSDAPTGRYDRATQRKKEDEYTAMMQGQSSSQSKERKRKLYDDAYLEGDDDDDDEDDGRGRHRKKESAAKPDEDGEEDELDAFMAGIDKQARVDAASSKAKELTRPTGRGAEDEKDNNKMKLGRQDIEGEEDMVDDYLRFMEEKKEQLNLGDDEDNYEYDQEGNIIWTNKKIIDPLPPIDHSTIQYKPFTRNFYQEHDDIKALTEIDAVKLRLKLDIRTAGVGVPKPVASFAHFNFDRRLLEVIRRSEFEHPTPIQAQAIPAALLGRDVLGIAKTGSGKTAAYLWPAVVHIMDQDELKPGDGPIVLVVVPTRELAIQVYQEARRVCHVLNLNAICAYGGGSKWEQQNELQQQGAELVVCTPGRIIDLIKIGATNLQRCTFLVFDEADRMFDMGFEAQVNSISAHVRPDRQCLMFSATFKKKVERLARNALSDPVRIVQGHVGEANEDIRQEVIVVPNADEKYRWLIDRLVHFQSQGKVLVFVTRKTDAELVAHKLKKTGGQDPVLLHGDMLQLERNEQLTKFRKDSTLLVATDVAARGLDIPDIRTVVNYDVARDMDTHVHRVGRTGRAGNQGNAYTLVGPGDFDMAAHLVLMLEAANQQVQPQLLEIARKANWFNAQHGKRAGFGASSSGQARGGLGYQQPASKPGSSSADSDPLSVHLGGGAHSSLQAAIVPPPPPPPPPAQSYPTSSAISSSSYSAAPSFYQQHQFAPPPPPPPPHQQQQQQSSSSNRLDQLKSAYKRAFTSSFQKASAPQEQPSTITDPRPEWRKKLDEINAKISAQSQQPPSNPDQGGGRSSRWQQ